jgi:hypothetical protein
LKEDHVLHVEGKEVEAEVVVEVMIDIEDIESTEIENAEEVAAVKDLVTKDQDTEVQNEALVINTALILLLVTLHPHNMRKQRSKKLLAYEEQYLCTISQPVSQKTI